jgi:hypothetical protein
MKIFLISICTTVLLYSCNGFNDKPNNGFVDGGDKKLFIDPSDSLKKTEILWIDSAVKDLGNLKKPTIAEISFRFKNIGKKPLSINSVSAACGCTNPQKPSKLIQPGEEGVVKAQFNTENQNVGQVQKSITVLSNTNPQDKTLHFTANILDK